jgi:hypothetical protein
MLNAITVGPHDDAWAVGQQSSDHEVTYQTIALHWDARRWRVEPIRPRH